MAKVNEQIQRGRSRSGVPSGVTAIALQMVGRSRSSGPSGVTAIALHTINYKQKEEFILKHGHEQKY
jgi:hypothetical protein